MNFKYIVKIKTTGMYYIFEIKNEWIMVTISWVPIEKLKRAILLYKLLILAEDILKHNTKAL